MDIAVRPRNADRARQLKASAPFMTPGDIADVTGIPLRQVENALHRKPKGDKRKSRVR